MKKIFILALAASLAAVSCQEMGVYENNNEANVTIKVGFPETKAISDGLTATTLIYEVYHVGGTDASPVYTLVTDETATLTNKTTSLNFTLMRDNKYVALFWAQSPNAPYVTDNLRAVDMNYADDPTVPNGNNEHRDAFCAAKEFTVSDTDANNNLTCKLYRPFSQLNFVATDYEQRDADNITSLALTSSVVTISHLSPSYDVLTGIAAPAPTNPGDHVFDANAVIEQEFDTDTKKTWISMNYVLLPDGASTIEVEAEFVVNATYNTNNTIIHTINFPKTGVNAGKNYRTNIVGELFTEGGKVDITVDPAYSQPDNNLNVD